MEQTGSKYIPIWNVETQHNTYLSIPFCIVLNVEKNTNIFSIEIYFLHSFYFSCDFFFKFF